MKLLLCEHVAHIWGPGSLKYGWNDHKNNAGSVTRGIAELPIQQTYFASIFSNFNSWQEQVTLYGHGETRGGNDRRDRFSNVEISGDGKSLIVGAWDASYARIYGLNNNGNWTVEAGPTSANQSISNPLIGTGYGYGTGGSYYKLFRDWYGHDVDISDNLIVLIVLSIL